MVKIFRGYDRYAYRHLLSNPKVAPNLPEPSNLLKEPSIKKRLEILKDGVEEKLRQGNEDWCPPV